MGTDHNKPEGVGGKYSCPGCGYYFRWGERAELTQWLFFRKPAKCPECDNLVIWEKNAWRMSFAALNALIAIGVLHWTIRRFWGDLGFGLDCTFVFLKLGAVIVSAYGWMKLTISECENVDESLHKITDRFPDRSGRNGTIDRTAEEAGVSPEAQAEDRKRRQATRGCLWVLAALVGMALYAWILNLLGLP